MPDQRALFIESQDGPVVVRNRPVPTPGPQELLVKIHAAALNPVDWKLWATGVMPGMKYPFIGGSDIAGEVERVGENVQGWSKGDKLFFQGFYRDDYAGFQQYTLIDAGIVAKIPADGAFSYADYTTIPVALSAAMMGIWGDGAGLKHSLDQVPHYQGKPVVVIGGSSSVGQYVIQTLRLSGFSPIISYSSTKHFKHLQTLGATHCIDRYITPLAGLAAAVKAIVGASIEIIYDAVGSEESQRGAYATIASGGKILTVNRLKIPAEEISPDKSFITIFASSHLPNHRAFAEKMYKHLPALLEAGAIVPNNWEILPDGLDGVVGGMTRMKNNEISGIKLVAFPQMTA